MLPLTPGPTCNGVEGQCQQNDQGCCDGCISVPCVTLLHDDVEHWRSKPGRFKMPYAALQRAMTKRLASLCLGPGVPRWSSQVIGHTAWAGGRQPCSDCKRAERLAQAVACDAVELSCIQLQMRMHIACAAADLDTWFPTPAVLNM